MENNNPIREHYYVIVACGLCAIIALFLTILKVPLAVRLSLFAVAAIVFITILAKAARAS